MRDKMVELNLLIYEEKILTKIADKLQDYLTRLQVEELTIRNQIKSKALEEDAKNNLITVQTMNTKQSEEEIFGEDVNYKSTVDLSLAVKAHKSYEKSSEPEEEEDDDEGAVEKTEVGTSKYSDQLQAFFEKKNWTFPNDNEDEENEDDMEFDIAKIIGN